jgi:hypothetical protein
VKRTSRRAFAPSRHAFAVATRAASRARRRRRLQPERRRALHSPRLRQLARGIAVTPSAIVGLLRSGGDAGWRGRMGPAPQPPAAHGARTPPWSRSHAMAPITAIAVQPGGASPLRALTVWRPGHPVRWRRTRPAASGPATAGPAFLGDFTAGGSISAQDPHEQVAGAGGGVQPVGADRDAHPVQPGPRRDQRHPETPAASPGREAGDAEVGSVVCPDG